MKIVISGHRGAGKTSLLRRLQKVFNVFTFVDLDQRIEEVTTKSISALFQQHGEAGFRKIELETYQSLTATNLTVIAVGGGFPVDQISEDDLVIFVRRISDSAGRLFLNRPRLKPEISPLQESLELFAPRQDRFLQRADFIYHMPEGMDLAGSSLFDVESALFSKIFSFVTKESTPSTALDIPQVFQLPKQMVHAIITLEPVVLQRPKRWQLFAHFANELGFFVELRDDLLTDTRIAEVIQEISPQQIVYSCRRIGAKPKTSWTSFAAVDWAVELGEVPEELLGLVEKLIVSCHNDDKEENISILRAKSPPHAKKKCSPLVNSFSELCLSEDENINFLPRSVEGRWRWYRLLRAQSQALNYYRYWQGSAADQASFFEMFSFIPKISAFAAVLGDPVQFSFSPVFHHQFFYERHTCMLPIQVREEEWDVAFATLKKLGLRWAAVTSPLKKLLFATVQKRGAGTEDFQSANTYCDSVCENTDQVGLKALLEIENSGDWVVWGGGGTLEMIRHLLPRANFVSVRGGSGRDLRPRQILWAAPRKEPMIFPPEEWHPETVVDLNYNSNSPGLEYALDCGARYVSGLRMFIAQAEAQQQIWSR